MAFALLSVFEASIVEKIYNYAKERSDVDVLVKFYPHEWDCDVVVWRFTVPKDADVGDLKLMVCDYFDLDNCWTPDEIGLCVHQPWRLHYDELDEDEEVLPYLADYDAFWLKFK